MTSTRLLPTKFTLYDVDDVEAHVGKAVRRWKTTTGTVLSTGDEEDLTAYLLGTAWEIAAFKYDPSSGKLFSSFSYSILQLRATDWLRKKEGRTKWKFSTYTYERERPATVSLDGPVGDGTPLGATLADVAGDIQAAGRSDDDRWLLAESRRHQDRDHRTLREEAARRAPGGDPNARPGIADRLDSLRATPPASQNDSDRDPLLAGRRREEESVRNPS